MLTWRSSILQHSTSVGIYLSRINWERRCGRSFVTALLSYGLITLYQIEQLSAPVCPWPNLSAVELNICHLWRPAIHSRSSKTQGKMFSLPRHAQLATCTWDYEGTTFDASSRSCRASLLSCRFHPPAPKDGSLDSFILDLAAQYLQKFYQKKFAPVGHDFPLHALAAHVQPSRILLQTLELRPR